MKIHLLFGTETGNAEMLCEDIEAELSGNFECEITNMGIVDPLNLQSDTFYMFVTSTYGSGDLPATAVPFMDALDAKKPNLAGIAFAIFGLGDQVFPDTYNHGSLRLSEKLLECGAEMIGERGLYDASTALPPEDIGCPWAHNILALVEEKAA